MSILYITSFNSKLYELSGERLLRTFKSTRSEGDLLCCTDDFDTDLSSDNIFQMNMDEDPFYDEWFQSNLSVIPEELGGTATRHSNEMAYLTPNYRTAQWVRKIAAMNYAKNNVIEKYDHFMWVDCDCFFTSKFTEKDLEKALCGKSFCYHYGRDRAKKRMGVETGLLGFKNDKPSDKVLTKWIRKYTSGDYLDYKNWNDAHMFFYILEGNKKLKVKDGIDLVSNYKSTGRSRSHVIIRGALGTFFDHNKGLHKRNM